MSTKTLNVKMQVRRDTAANWENVNPILAEGEMGYDTTNKLTKIGDGVTEWKKLSYFSKENIIDSFSNCDWTTIAKVAAAGTASKYFNVGDEKVVELSTGEQITVVILGFNHDELTAGGTAPISIGMKDCLQTTYSMNSSDTSSGGWDKSKMRSQTMQTLLSQLPSDLAAVIKPVNKKASAGNLSSTITTSSDKLWLFSEVEIDNTTASTYVNEGKQYDYWKTFKNGTLAADRVKKRNGYSCDWWLRSPNMSYSSRFVCINGSGTVVKDSYSYVCASQSNSVSFGFCI